MHCLVFDIETVPDTDLGRRLHGLGDLDETQVAQIMVTRRRQETGAEFLPLEQQKVVAISVGLRTRESFRVWSLGEPDSSEREIVERFFDGIERFTPDLISWNGSGFDLPVLHYRSLLYGIAAPRYWETGDGDPAFRYNNYLGRFHWRHTDLMDVLSGYQSRGRAGLGSVATLLSLPGKLGMSGEQVWDRYLAGDLEGIRNYCETDVLNTYLIYLRFQLIRGVLGSVQYEEEIARIRGYLAEQTKPHFAQFLAAWK